MNNNVKLWLEALRSGNYQQGYFTLAGGGKFCCLGVACDLYQKNVGDLKINIKFGDGLDEDEVFYDESSTFLPDKVSQWLGGIPQKIQGLLTYENDIENKSFIEIADIIEKYLETENGKTWKEAGQETSRADTGMGAHV